MDDVGRTTVCMPKSAYHKNDVMVCFFRDIAILVSTISALVYPIPALHISCKAAQHGIVWLQIFCMRSFCKYATLPCNLVDNVSAQQVLRALFFLSATSALCFVRSEGTQVLKRQERDFNTVAY